VEHGADVNSPDEMGKTPLVRAVHMGQTEMVRWLLQHGANPTGQTATGREGPTGLTPLHVAVIQNHADVAELLLAYGADASATDDEGRTPLDWAHIRGSPAPVEVLGGEASDETRQAEPRVVWPGRDISLWETGVKAPENAVIAGFVPHTPVLKRSTLVINHAGHGIVSKAMTHGVSMVLLPWHRDQPGVADRVEKLGVARVVPRAHANPAEVRQAVTTVLDTPHYREAASHHAKRLAAIDPGEIACSLLEGFL